MAPLAKFLRSDAQVHPRIVEYLTDSLQMETISDFKHYWTAAEYETGVWSDVVEQIQGFQDVPLPERAFQVERLQAAWLQAQDSKLSTLKVVKNCVDWQEPTRALGLVPASKQAEELSQPLLGQSEKPDGAVGSEEIEAKLLALADQAAFVLESSIFHMELDDLPADFAAARRDHVNLLHADRWHARAVVCLVFLTFLEVPAWCRGPSLDPWSWRGADVCLAGGGAGNPRLSGVAFIPPFFGLLVELVCQALVLRMYILNYIWRMQHLMQPGTEVDSTRLAKLGMALAIAGPIDTAVFIVFGCPFRLSFLIRSGLVLLLPGVRRSFVSLFNLEMMAEVSSVATFYITTIVLSSFVWMTVFQMDIKVAYMEEGEAVRSDKGFTDLGDSSYSMFVAASSVGFMDVILPSFSAHRSSALMWLVYLVVMKVLLKNMVLDVMVSQYMKTQEALVAGASQRQARAAFRAFRLLAGRADALPREAFLRFARALQRSPLWRQMPEEALELLHESTGGAQESFSDVCMILRGNMSSTQRLARLGLREDALSSRWRRFVLEPEEAPALERLMDRVLMLNLLLMIVESTYDVMKWDELVWAGSLEISFAFAYLAECCIKLSVKTWEEYWSCTANRFDFVSTWVLLATSLLPSLPLESPGKDLSHYANILRLLRLVKVLKELKDQPTTQFMLKAITRIVTAGQGILALLGLSIFFFGGLCVNLFGGVLYEGNPKLEGTEYGKKHWYYLNFNDMFTACATFFSQLLSEFVPEMADALSSASSWPRLSWWVFILFFTVTSTVMYDTVIAFTVETYMAVKEETWKEEEEAEEEPEAEQEREREEAIGPGEPTGAEGAEVEYERLAEGAALEQAEADERANEEAYNPPKFFKRMEEQLAEGGRAVHWSPVVLQEFDSAVHKEYAQALARERLRQPAEPEQWPGQTPRECTCWAAWVLSSVVQGGALRERPADVALAWGRRIQGVLAEGFYCRLMALLVLLSFVETPLWCRSPGEESTWRGWAFMASEQRCPAPHASNLQLSGVPYVPPGLGLALELALLVAIGRSFLFMLRLGEDRAQCLGLAGLFFVLCNVADALSVPLFERSFRYTFFFRTALLCCIPEVTAFFRLILNRKMMGEFAFTVQVLVVVVLLFAWIFFTLLRDADDTAWGEGHEAVRVNQGFQTLGSSVYTMCVAAISDGFVDLLLPSLQGSTACALLWVTFLLLTQVLLLNLVIDAFIAAFLSVSEKLEERAAKLQGEGITEVFRLLAPRGCPVTDDTVISQEALLDWSEELGRSPAFAGLERRTVLALLSAMGDVRRQNFCDLCLLMQFRVQVIDRDSLLKAWAPELWDSPRFLQLRRAVWEPREAPALDVIFDVVLLLNLVVMVAQFSLQPSAWLSLASCLFTCAYVVEVILKLSVKSFEEYWMSHSNRFDFATTWLLFGTMLISLSGVANFLHRYTNLLRLVRFLRVAKGLKNLKSFQFMMNAVVRMLCAARIAACAEGIVLFAFATLCTNCLGGAIYRGNPKLEGTELKEKSWTVFNFNDMPMAFFTWFTQLLNEYSDELADAIFRASPEGAVAWWLVPAFYVVAVAIFFEILVAFMIETFLALKEEAEELDPYGEEEEEEEEEPELQQAEILAEMQGKLGTNRSLHFNGLSDMAFQRKLKGEYLKLCMESGP